MEIQRRSMAVSEDADVGLLPIQPSPRLFGHDPLFIQNVADGYLTSTPANDETSRESAVLVVIDVAGDGRDRGELPQTLKHVSISNISRMKDFGHACKMLFDSRIIEPVRIGNHSDSTLPTLFYGVGTGCAPSESWTVFHWKVKGSGVVLGSVAISALSRSARPALIGWVESHSTRPFSFSDSR